MPKPILSKLLLKLIADDEQDEIRRNTHYIFLHQENIVTIKIDSNKDFGADTEEETQALRKKRLMRPFSQQVMNKMRLMTKKQDGIVAPKSKLDSPLLDYALFRSRVPYEIKKVDNVNASALKPLTILTSEWRNRIYVVYPGGDVFEVVKGNYIWHDVPDSSILTINTRDEYIMTKDSTMTVEDDTKILRMIMYLPHDQPVPSVLKRLPRI